MRELDAQRQWRKQLLRWFIYHWNVGTWRFWVSLCWINPGDFLRWPTMNLGSLHRILGKSIHKHCIIDSYRLHTSHDNRRTAGTSWLGVVFCANDETCHIVNKRLILGQISSFPWNQLLSSFLWILPLVNTYICGWIQWLKLSIQYLLRCQRCRLTSILLLRDNIYRPMLRM